MTASEHRVLTRLVEAARPLTQRQLADALGVSQATVSRVLLRLIASGEVRRIAPRRRATVPGKPPATYARLEPEAVP